MRRQCDSNGERERSSREELTASSHCYAPDNVLTLLFREFLGSMIRLGGRISALVRSSTGPVTGSATLQLLPSGSRQSAWSLDSFIHHFEHRSGDWAPLHSKCCHRVHVHRLGALTPALVGKSTTPALGPFRACDKPTRLNRNIPRERGDSRPRREPNTPAARQEKPGRGPHDLRTVRWFLQLAFASREPSASRPSPAPLSDPSSTAFSHDSCLQSRAKAASFLDRAPRLSENSGQPGGSVVAICTTYSAVSGLTEGAAAG
jgi:hypothetical protein